MQTSEPQIPNLNVYCQSEGLLFQFVLSEFLMTSQKVSEIEKIYFAMEALLIKNRLSADITDYLSRLIDLFPHLTGAQMVVSNEQTFPWTQSKGSLNKLRHYCYLLSQMNKDFEELEKMNIAVSKAFHSSLQMKEVIYSLKRQAEEQEIPSFIALYQLIDKLLDNMRKTSRLILKILIHFKDDENILFFLLRYQKSFDQAYKTKFVPKILAKMYPGGIESAKNLLMEKYAKRGFSNLLESISAEMHNLEKM